MVSAGILAACIKSRPQLFEGIHPLDLDTILTAATQRHFAAKAPITNQGYPADHLFLLTKGRARYTFTTQEGKKTVLVWLAPGEILGAAALLSKPSTYVVSSEAVEATSVVAWDRVTIRGLAHRYPRLVENALWTATEYLIWYAAAHAALTTQNAEQRLSEVVTCLAQVIGREVPDGVELDVINDELASAANITRFTTSRLLGKWRRSGLIRKHRGKLVLPSTNCLQPQNR